VSDGSLQQQRVHRGRRQPAPGKTAVGAPQVTPTTTGPQRRVVASTQSDRVASQRTRSLSSEHSQHAGRSASRESARRSQLLPPLTTTSTTTTKSFRRDSAAYCYTCHAFRGPTCTSAPPGEYDSSTIEQGEEENEEEFPPVLDDGVDCVLLLHMFLVI